MKIKSKLPDVGITIFTIMSKLAAEHNAINLSQGFPDFDAPDRLIELVVKYMRSGFNQYAPMEGIPELRSQIAAKVKKIYGADVDPDKEITVTSGATEALYASISAVVNPGDEVIIFEPAYDSYVPAVKLNGGIPVFIQLKFPEYRIDWNEVTEAVSSRTKLIILNSPHNPTGTVLSGKDINSLRELTHNTDILIISDEVYEHIIFDGLTHESMLRFPELAEKSFVISSFGKTYHTTGWKIGYCVAPEILSTEFRKIHQFLTFASNTPVQYAYAEMMKEKSYYNNLAVFYQKKRDRFISCLEASGLMVLSCSGTYFLMVDYSAVSDESDYTFAERITTEYGVAAIPPSAFYNKKQDDKVLRFCFAKKDETLKKAAEILCRL